MERDELRVRYVFGSGGFQVIPRIPSPSMHFELQSVASGLVSTMVPVAAVQVSIGATEGGGSHSLLDVFGGIFVEFLLAGCRAEVEFGSVAEACVLGLVLCDVHFADWINCHAQSLIDTCFWRVSKIFSDTGVDVQASTSATLTTHPANMLHD